MSHGAREEPLLGPSPVTVHDKGDMPERFAHLDGLDVLDLLGEHGVDLLGVLVGRLLDVIEDVMLLVLGKGFILLDLVVEVLPDVAQGNLSVFRIFLALLDQLLPSILAGGRELEHDGAAVDDRIATEIRLVQAGENVFGGGRIEGLTTKSVAEATVIEATCFKGMLES